MKQQCKQWLCLMLCFLLLFGMLPTTAVDLQLHDHGTAVYVSGHDHGEDGHGDDGHGAALLLSVCEDVLGAVLGAFALPVSAAYEDGVECEYCGGYRYDDWKCDNGDHCGDGADGDCYSDHHCGECGDCVEDGGLCDDCEFCFECCAREDKCRGCYEIGETVCADCGEKCSGCAWICGECGKCTDCIGDETYCSYCDICIECAEWICYCGDGCSECAFGCEDCNEKCTKCSGDELCLYCWICFDCAGGDGNYCAECQKCKFCVDVVCACGAGCSECAYVCPECGEYCENCADGYICMECGICDDCAGGDNNFCHECLLCKEHIDYICFCGEGCSNCAVICPECSEKCEACADDELCSGCGVCFECVGGEGNYCAECGLCKNCVEICSCGNGCVECAAVCLECFDKCTNCAEEEICGGCGICRDCAGGDGNFCDNCETCKMCSDFICICGGGCSECVDFICPECNETCSECAPEEICGGCGICKDCAGGEGNFCDNCETCKMCSDFICICGGGCSECVDRICPECNEKCSECADDELCMECGVCIDCCDAERFCVICGLCSDCGTVCPCGEGCENCADLCPECLEACSVCCDEFCSSCDLCLACVDERMCEDCHLCGECTELCTDCGEVCLDCAESVCEECGKCADCLNEFCPDCGICIDCADGMCSDCHYCSDCCEALCDDCGAYCSACAAYCEDCGKCEFCMDCDHTAVMYDGHRLMAPVITRKPGYTYTGEQQRSCMDCRFTVKETVPMLTLPEYKFVVTIAAEWLNDNSGAPVIELLSRGSKPCVPALPTLAPDKNGVPFYGWVDQKTERSVKKGDPMTSNLSLKPVWRERIPVSDLPFTDVKSRDYYAEAVAWAYENGITAGTSDTTFSPDMTCTRAQVVTFLWRVAGCPEPVSTKNPFVDVKASDWYYKAVLWAVEQKITQGTSAGTFTPTRECSTAEILTFLYRSVGAGDNGYYQEAAAWAESYNLVKVTGLAVNPTTLCPRKAIVSFLYGIYG